MGRNLQQVPFGQTQNALANARALEDHASSLASIVIFVLRSLEIGHPALALFAAVSNFALSAPGILAVTSKWTDVTVKPASVFSSVTAAVVRILSAVMPALPNWPERAIEKHPA